MEKTTGKIVDLEWSLFDEVQNIGGRADCQDDQKTFYIMRSSQFDAWSPQMRDSYLNDLLLARAEGRNLLSEKYGYMMESTAPADYMSIKELLPPLSEGKIRSINYISSMHVRWQEELALKFPLVSGRGRSLHEEEDSLYSTSFETYLRGELSTYSERTLNLYELYIAQLDHEGENMNEMILLNTARSYGYDSIDDAEAHLASKG